MRPTIAEQRLNHISKVLDLHDDLARAIQDLHAIALTHGAPPGGSTMVQALRIIEKCKGAGHGPSQ